MMTPTPHPALVFILRGRVKPYMTRTRGSLHASARSREYYASQQHLAWQLCDQMKWHEPLSGQVAYSMHFTRSGRMADLDNLVKAVSDAARGIVWTDDRQVRQIEAHLRAGTEDVTQFYVWRL